MPFSYWRQKMNETKTKTRRVIKAGQGLVITLPADFCRKTGLKLLEKALSREKKLVRLIGIGVSNLTEPGRQLNMLDTSARRLEQLNKAIDRIRKKYGFTAIQSGRTLPLKDIFPESDDGYTLHTPSLSR